MGSWAHPADVGCIIIGSVVGAFLLICNSFINVTRFINMVILPVGWPRKAHDAEVFTKFCNRKKRMLGTACGSRSFLSGLLSVSRSRGLTIIVKVHYKFILAKSSAINNFVQ